jgi:hypothetical protein
MNHLVIKLNAASYSEPACSCDSGEFKDDLFGICTFHDVIWNNILGKFDLQ